MSDDAVRNISEVSIFPSLVLRVNVLVSNYLKVQHTSAERRRCNAAYSSLNKIPKTCQYSSLPLRLFWRCVYITHTPSSHVDIIGLLDTERPTTGLL